MPWRSDKRSAVRKKLCIPGYEGNRKRRSKAANGGDTARQAPSKKDHQRGSQRLQLLWQSSRPGNRAGDRNLPPGIYCQEDGGGCCNRSSSQGQCSKAQASKGRPYTSGRRTNGKRRYWRCYRLIQGTYRGIPG